MGSSTGQIFRVTTFGESHGPAMGGVVEGCPSGIELDPGFIQADLDKRRPGQSPITTPRKEADQIELLSGIYQGRTTGTPIGFTIRNTDHRSRDYAAVEDLYRPGHADFTYEARYGHRDPRGGGRASARETVARVAGGAIARAFLAQRHGIRVAAWVDQVGPIKLRSERTDFTATEIEATVVRCPDKDVAKEMQALIEEVARRGDTLGGCVSAAAHGVPPGLGDPVFDKLEADLAKACLSLPACKGFEIGSGFAGVLMRGSEHNDPFVKVDDEVVTKTNHAGGVLGGISTGNAITLRCAFKPVSTHYKPQQTVTTDGTPVTLTNTGRHDPCVLPRAVPLVEAALLITLADHALRFQAIRA